MNFETTVAAIIEQCPGALSGAIVDPDGIPVVNVPERGALEEVGAEFSTILRNVSEAERELHHGELVQFTVHAREADLVLTLIGGGYFLLLHLETGGHVGKARFLSRLAAVRLYSEFV